MCSRFLLSLIIILCVSIGGTAQSSYLAKISHFGIKNGLFHREVFNVHQDQLGFIWVGQSTDSIASMVWNLSGRQRRNKVLLPIPFIIFWKMQKVGYGY